MNQKVGATAFKRNEERKRPAIKELGRNRGGEQVRGGVKNLL